MLHLPPKSYRLSLFPQPSKRLELSPVPLEEDELLQAIEAAHEAPWDLEPVPDTAALSEFWSSVEGDLRDDPDWVSFSEDGE